jgi:hypothetical protein
MTDSFISMDQVSSKPDFIPLDHVSTMTKPEGGTSVAGMSGAVTRGLAPYAAGAAAGAAIGAPFGGVGAIPGAAVGAGAVGLTQLALGLYNPIAKRFGLPEAVTPQEATDKLLDFAGVKRPSTGIERETEAITGGAAGGLTGAGAASQVAERAAPGLVKSVAERAAQAPGLQVASGAAGGAGAQTAAEAGAGQVGQMVAGMAAGAVPGVVPGAAGASVGPKARQLLDAGVELTPGQLAGNVPKRAEEAAKSIPITGSVIRSAEGRSLDTFNLATANKALEPIGIAIPKGTAGRDIISQGQQALSKAYDQLLSQMHFRADQDFQTDVANLQRMVQTLPADRQSQFHAVLSDVQQRLSPTQSMLGDNLKIATSELKNFATMYKRSPMAGEQQVGHAVDALNDAIHNGLRRQNPQQAQELDKVDLSYAMFVRIEDAANRSAVANGRFTPGQLLQAIKGNEPTVRRRGFARGDSLMQDWAQTAYDVMGNKMPDSGSPERLLWDTLGGGSALLMAPKVAAGIGASSLPYTRSGGQAIRNLVNTPTTPLPLITNPGLMATTPAENAANAIGAK